MANQPRHNEMHELATELKRIEDRAFALSVYDFPEDMKMSDLILFSLTVYDTPERYVDIDGLKEVFAMCGRFGVVAINGALMDTPPYVNLGEFGDSVERLGSMGLISIEDELRLTEGGLQVGAVIFGEIKSRSE